MATLDADDLAAITAIIAAKIPSAINVGPSGSVYVASDAFGNALATASTVLAIKAKTDNLPSDPADQSLLAALIASAISESTAEIASAVYSKLAGGRSTLLSGPTSAGGPVDQVKTVDLSLTVPITVPADSELLWFMRCHPDAPNAYLVASKTAGLTQLMTNTSPTAGQASVTRNANNVAIVIKAAALSQLPSETVACELRERTVSGQEISRHEVEITLRHSAGRN
jgi:hypothetical protein